MNRKPEGISPEVAIAATRRGTVVTRQHRTRYYGGVADLSARENHRLISGLSRLLGFSPPRILAELLLEMTERSLDRAEMLDQIERYAAVSTDALQAVGGDRFPPRALHEVPL